MLNFNLFNVRHHACTLLIRMLTIAVSPEVCATCTLNLPPSTAARPLTSISPPCSQWQNPLACNKWQKLKRPPNSSSKSNVTNWLQNQPFHLAHSNVQLHRNNQFKSDQSLACNPLHHLAQTVLYIDLHNSGCSAILKKERQQDDLQQQTEQ